MVEILSMDIWQIQVKLCKKKKKSSLYSKKHSDTQSAQFLTK